MPVSVKQIGGSQGKLAISFTCTATEQVGDLVYISASDTVAQADASDVNKILVIGWILEKSNTTNCLVTSIPGPVTSSGLTAGAKVYLSPSTPGSATATEPSSPDIIVEVGIAKSTTSFIFMKPEIIG